MTEFKSFDLALIITLKKTADIRQTGYFSCGKKRQFEIFPRTESFSDTSLKPKANLKI